MSTGGPPRSPNKSSRWQLNFPARRVGDRRRAVIAPYVEMDQHKAVLTDSRFRKDCAVISSDGAETPDVM
jgi:hypothetical protein